MALTTKKITSMLLGVMLSFLLLEAGLRLGGFILLAVQEHDNVRSAKQKNTYRILCLGESTTYRQYPAPLEEILNDRHIGVRFKVIDEGRPGTNTLAILSRVEGYLTQYRPDMVVAMMGINDRRIGYYQDVMASDAWFYNHCRTYRLAKILATHFLKKIRHEDIYGLSETGPKQKGTPENLKAPIGKPEKTILNSVQALQIESSLKRSIEVDPPNDKACITLGRLYKSQGNFAKAGNLFKNAIEINPANEDAYVELGGLYGFLDQFSQAEALLKKALELNPKNDKAYVELGELYQMREGHYRAEDFFKKALEINPQNDSAYTKLGALYRRQGKYSQAEDCYRKAIEINPINIQPVFELSGLYRDRGKLSESVFLLQKTLQHNPNNVRALASLASLYKEMGKPESAQTYVDKAKALGLEDQAVVTANDYRKLKDILDRKKVKLVCVQYPMRSVEPFKRILGSDEGVIFVDNERIFKDAVKQSGYKEYFRDMFAGDFGHCTPKGNRLLAQNIADTILREVFYK